MGIDQTGWASPLEKLARIQESSGNLRQQVFGGYDVGAGNILVVNVRTNLQAKALIAQPTMLGFFILWGQSPRKNTPPVEDPGPAYPGLFDGGAVPPVPGAPGRFYCGNLIRNAYPTAPPAGIVSWDWHWPLYRIPVQNEPAIPVLPWSEQPGSPGPNHLVTDLLYLIPAPMDYARLLLYVTPNPFNSISSGLSFEIQAGAMHGCQGFDSLVQRP